MLKNQFLFDIFRSLKARNYRLFFMGQGISLIGTWMQMIAMSWLVYRLTGSPLMLGLVGFSGQIPMMLITPIAGVFADRWNKHRTIVITQTLMMIQALVLGLLVITKLITIRHIFALSVFMGLVTAFDMPVRQAFVPEMVEDKNHLSNAIALNSSLFNGARLIGPSIAGIVISAFGEGVCFLLNSASYLAVIFALLAMRVQKRSVVKQHVFEEFKDGFSYTAQHEPIRNIMMLLAFISLLGMPYAILMPAYAKDVLGGGARTLGFLMAASGIGALTAALYLASRKSVRGLIKRIGMAAGIFGAGIALFALSRNFWLSFAFLIAAGFGMMTQMASSNTIVQTLVDDRKRGRVMGFYAMAFVGTAPFGSLLAGWLAGKIGTPQTLLFCGLASLAGAGIYASYLPVMREKVRPVYMKMGIIDD